MAAARVESFPPSIDGRCRVLVLGSAPSVRSLARGEYYGHPQNHFWPFIEELFGVARSLPYRERLRRLRARGVALWDVAGRCNRVLSSDASIDDVEPNDLVGLLAGHRRLRAVFFNGAKSEQLFDRLVRPRLAAPRSLHFTRLPSTSPANASIPRARKLARWRRMLDWV